MCQAGRGWEVNSGVLAVRQKAAWFVRLWADEVRAGLRTYSMLTGVDQSALMWVLAHEPKARLFPMPALYNFRQVRLRPCHTSCFPLRTPHTFLTYCVLLCS